MKNVPTWVDGKTRRSIFGGLALEPSKVGSWKLKVGRFF